MPGPCAWRRPLVLAVDLVAICWLLAMVALGEAASKQIENLSGVSDSMALVSQSEVGFATALTPLAQLPLVSGNITGVQEQLRQAAASTADDAAVTRSSLASLAALARTAIVLIALLPLLVVYAPMRISRLLAIRALRHDMRRYARSPAFEAYLAHRALATFSFSDLRRITPDPARDVRNGHNDALARALLRRAGVSDERPTSRRRRPAAS